MPNQRIRGNQITDPRTITQNEHQEKADAKRVMIVDENGNPVNEANPLPTNATFTGNLEVALDPESDGVHLGDKLTGDTAQIDAQRRLRVLDADAKVALENILTELQAGSISIGTEDGTPSGVQHVFVNNLKQMILAAHDRIRNVSYLDINSKKNRRVDKFEYSSPTFSGITLVRQFNYTLVGTDYVFTNDAWILI